MYVCVNQEPGGQDPTTASHTCEAGRVVGDDPDSCEAKVKCIEAAVDS